MRYAEKISAKLYATNSQTNGDIQMALVRISVGIAATNWIDFVAAVLLLLHALRQPRSTFFEIDARNLSSGISATRDDKEKSKYSISCKKYSDRL